MSLWLIGQQPQRAGMGAVVNGKKQLKLHLHACMVPAWGMEEHMKAIRDGDRMIEIGISVIAIALLAAMVLFGIDLWRMTP
jgi:hypothetical protein